MNYQGLLAPQLDRLPTETLTYILSNLSYEELRNVCMAPANRRIRSFCSNLIKNELFWQNKFHREIEPNLTYDERENLPRGMPGFSGADTWRDYFLKVYHSDIYNKALLRRQLQNIGFSNKVKGVNLTLDDLISDKSTYAYLLGVFTLPLPLANKYLNMYLKEHRSDLYNLRQVPKYVLDIQKYLLSLDDPNRVASQSPIHKVPTGYGYGFRIALILLVNNGLTPEQAQLRLNELNLGKFK